MQRNTVCCGLEEQFFQVFLDSAHSLGLEFPFIVFFRKRKKNLLRMADLLNTNS